MRADTSRRLSPLDRDQLAPAWHTAALVALICAVALTGISMQLMAAAGSGTPNPRGLAPAAMDRIFGQYLPLLLVNWGLTAYVSRLFRPRNALPDLLGRGFQSVRQVLIDLALAVSIFVFVQAFEAISVHVLVTGRNAALHALLPSTVAERLTWVLVALSVGFCEEVVYRGYLQTQLAAFSGRPAVGVAAQALLFGLAHAEQGFAPALRIAVYGLVFGILARYRRSLLPGIACHIAIDLLGVIAR